MLVYIKNLSQEGSGLGAQDQMQRNPGKVPSAPSNLGGPPLPRNTKGRGQDFKIQVGNQIQTCLLAQDLLHGHRLSMTFPQPCLGASVSPLLPC